MPRSVFITTIGIESFSRLIGVTFWHEEGDHTVYEILHIQLVEAGVHLNSLLSDDEFISHLKDKIEREATVSRDVAAFERETSEH